MERTEPTLVPEWLKSTGNIAGGGSLVHHSDASSANFTHSRSFRSNGGKDSPHYLNRSSSFDSRLSGNNGSAKHPYSSFSRSHRDKKRGREKGKPFSEDIRDPDMSESLARILNHRVERNASRHCQSLVSRNPVEALYHRLNGSRAGINGVGSLSNSNPRKEVFEKDFPSVGKEEKQDVTRARTGLTSAIHILPTGNSGYLVGEKWTSALAEVPGVNVDNGVGHTSLQKNVAAFPSCSASVSASACLNMAEALSQPSVRTRETPQLPDKSHILEELAIKQSRRLIPITPSVPKSTVPSSGDKSKQPKATVRSSDSTVSPRAIQPVTQSSHHKSRTGEIRHDSTSSTCHVGKFVVLKSGRENGTEKEKSCHMIGDFSGSKINETTPTYLSSTASAALSSSPVSSLGNKMGSLSLNSRSSLDKSRSEFFNLMRRKTPSHLATSRSDPSSVASHAKTGEMFKEGHGPLVYQMNCNGDLCDASEKNSNLEDDSLCGLIYPDEEEAAFLRSLGWEENSGDDEGLTEEEINAFYQRYMHRTPTLKLCHSFQLKCSMEAILEAVSSESTTSKTEPEA